MELDKSLASRTEWSGFTKPPSESQKVFCEKMVITPQPFKVILWFNPWEMGTVEAVATKPGLEMCNFQWWMAHWALAWDEWGNKGAPGKESLCQPSKPLFSLYYSWVWHSDPLIPITKPGNMETDFHLFLIYYSWHATKHYGVNLIALQLKYLFLCTWVNMQNLKP